MLRCVVVLIVGFISISSTVHLPSYFPICTRNGPKLDECLIEATKTIKPYLKKGIQELSIPTLSPFVIPVVKLEQGNSAINYKITLTNVTIQGMDDYLFKKLNYSSNNYELNGIVSFKTIFMKANYDLEGKILIAPLKGKGIVKVVTDSVTATFALYGEPKQENGLTYIKPKDAKIKLTCRNSTGVFDGLINNNKEISLATNRILNENYEEIHADAVPQIELAIRKLLITEFGEKTIGQVPYDEILPLSV